MKKKLFVRNIEVNSETPTTIYQKLVGEEKGFLLESNEIGKGRYSFIGKCMGEPIYLSHLEEIRSLMIENEVENNLGLPFIGGYVGAIAYDVALQVENIQSENVDLLHTPNILFFKVPTFVALDHYEEQMMLITIATSEEEAQENLNDLEQRVRGNKAIVKEETYFKGELQYHTEKSQFIQKVQKAKNHIGIGDIFQVVLSQRFHVDSNLPPFMVYQTLRELNPSPYLFYIHCGEFSLFGSSPESMVEVREGVVSTVPIAGTMPRGKTEEEDLRLEEELMQDEKEKAEHVMLVDLARNDIGRVTSIGTVEVPELMKVYRHSHVMHITSKVKGKLDAKKDGIDSILATLPAGTLSGAPKIRAMQIIEELEEEKRGFYGGAIGYLGFDGNVDVCIGIRMGIYKQNTYYFQAGAGIVMDSDPEKEYMECIHKSKALVRALELAYEKTIEQQEECL